MNDYSTVNILDLIEAVGENALSGVLFDFYRPQNMKKQC